MVTKKLSKNICNFERPLQHMRRSDLVSLFLNDITVTKIDRNKKSKKHSNRKG